MDEKSLYTPLIHPDPIDDKPKASWSAFPGSRRSAPPSVGPSPDKMLIKTGGNALQAVSRQTLESSDDLVAVSVPESGVNPGDMLYVAAPDGRMVEAVVPPGILPGHTFLVRLPPQDSVPLESLPTLAVDQTSVIPGRDVEDTDLRMNEELPQAVELVEQPTVVHAAPTEGDDTLVLVQVPSGSPVGSKLQVHLNDGRVIEATVPSGNHKEFYVRVPPAHQNWHDHPVALAAATVTPFLV